MNQQNKRIYVSVDPELEAKLDRLKQADYYARTHSDMLRDLIELGLQSLEQEQAAAMDKSPK